MVSVATAIISDGSSYVFGNRRQVRDYQTLLLTTPKPHVLLITLNRPEAANAFNTQMAKDLLEVFNALALDPGETRSVVLTGAGTRAFCAGADLKESALKNG